MSNHHHWIETERPDWRPWDAAPTFHFEDGNTLQGHWLNINTGARVCLMADGGWRNTAAARMRLFHRSPAGEQSEITTVLRDRALRGGAYEHLNGADAYVRVWASCAAVVSDMLGTSTGERS